MVLGGRSTQKWPVQLFDVTAEPVDPERLLRDDDAPEPPYWVLLWPGARVLAGRLLADPMVGPGLRMIEIGCGRGLPSLVAAHKGASVVATDRVHGALRALARDAVHNRLRLDLVRMDWREPALDGGFDLCVGADVGYETERAAELTRGCRELVRPGGRVWLADSVNVYRPVVEEALVAAGFAISVEQIPELEEGRTTWVRWIEATRRE